MASSKIPWIEIVPSDPIREPPGPEFSNYEWQALFACQVRIPDFKTWESVKWGFNAEALFREAMERQKEFFELQYGINRDLRVEDPSRRTLALRLCTGPNGTLLCALIGKICAESERDAETSSLSYLRSIQSSFPYEYSLEPALSEAHYRHLAGIDILSGAETESTLVQMQRCAMSVWPGRRPPYIQGHWNSAAHGHEPIWRSIASWPAPLLIDFTIRNTVLMGGELKALEAYNNQVASLQDPSVNQTMLASFKAWHQSRMDRIMAPGRRLFYLQVHLASSSPIDEHIIRTVGNALAIDTSGKELPGYRARYAGPDEKKDWLLNLRNLNIFISDNFPPVPRISEIADMEEVLSVMRIPYSPPGETIHGIRFSESYSPQA